jgi:hypothetical protein
MVKKTANELKAQVHVLTQQASDKTVECLSLHKQKENLANELDNAKVKQHEECRAAENARQALKQIQQTVQSKGRQGARTITSIISASKLPAKSHRRFNCSRTPLFQAIPIHRIIIDNLHLFLRVTDNLINLLITELRRMDGIEKCTSLDSCGAANINEYQSFLKNVCKIPFNFYVCKESRSLKWRGLTGPEKYKLFLKINIPELFPNLPNAPTIQEIWNSFIHEARQGHSFSSRLKY